MEKIKDTVTKVSKFFDLIGGYIYLALMVVVVFNVIMRTAFSNPFIGTVEIVELFSAVAIGLTISYCAILGEHVSIDFILEKFPEGFQKIALTLGYLLSLGFLGTAAWMIFQYGNSARINGNVTPTMGIAYHPFVYVIAIGFFVFFLVTLLQMFALYGRGGKK